MDKVTSLGNGRHSYKGFIIRKRRGMDMKRRAVSGYAIPGQQFLTLKAAIAWIDSQAK